MATPTDTLPGTAREALQVLFDLASDPVKDWTEERASRATLLATTALRDLRDRPQESLTITQLRADVEQLKRLGSELQQLVVPADPTFAPMRMEYAETEGLDRVNTMARQGWRVLQADPASEWFLLEREALAPGKSE